MKLLLDTHTFLWWCANNPKLSQTAVDAISDANNEVFVSVVNAWEIAIKARLGKLPLPTSPDIFMADMLRKHGFGVLPVSLDHAVGEFKLSENHGDPFDRLLVSQAKFENSILITNDSKLAKYEVNILW